MFRKGRRGITTLAIFSIVLVGAASGIVVLGSNSDSTVTRNVAATRLDRAKVAFADRDYKKAEEIAREYLTVSPNDVEARALLGRILVRRGRLNEARDLFTALLKDDPKHYEATRGLAEVYEGQGQADLAIMYWHRAAELRKDDPEIWREIGLAQYRKGDYLAALSSIQQSLALDPNQTDLSNIMTQVVTGKNAWEDPYSDPSAMNQGKGGFDPLNPRPIDPESLVPKPNVPDPMKTIKHGRK